MCSPLANNCGNGSDSGVGEQEQAREMVWAEKGEDTSHIAQLRWERKKDIYGGRWSNVRCRRKNG